ncbi:unnamed protein product [Ectocarpus sp. 6 AP-2014]
MASTGGATTLGTAAGAGGAALRLKFIFANHDGVVVEFETEPTTLVKDLKVALMGRWPTGVEPVQDLSHVRLVCMGFGILPDAKSLTECRVPHFDTHPTPVNVAIRPKNIQVPQSDGGHAAKQNPGGSRRNRGCCTVS